MYHLTTDRLDSENSGDLYDNYSRTRAFKKTGIRILPYAIIFDGKRFISFGYKDTGGTEYTTAIGFDVAIKSVLTRRARLDKRIRTTILTQFRTIFNKCTITRPEDFPEDRKNARGFSKPLQDKDITIKDLKKAIYDATGDVLHVIYIISFPDEANISLYPVVDNVEEIEINEIDREKFAGLDFISASIVSQIKQGGILI